MNLLKSASILTLCLGLTILQSGCSSSKTSQPSNEKPSQTQSQNKAKDNQQDNTAATPKAPVKIGQIQAPTGPIDPLDYFPINKSVSYIARDATNSNGAWIFKFIGKQIVGGNEVYVKSTTPVLWNTMQVMDKSTTYELYKLDDKGNILKVGSQDSSGKVKFKDKPSIELPAKMSVNNEYILYDESKDPVPGNVSKLVLKGVANIEVSGKTFDNTLVLEIHITGNNFNMTETEYYAKNLGLVYGTFKQGSTTTEEYFDRLGDSDSLK